MPHILNSVPYFVAAWLFVCGLYGIVTSRHLVHMVVCLAILQGSTYMLLLSIGYRIGGAGRSSRISLPVEWWWIRWCRR